MLLATRADLIETLDAAQRYDHEGVGLLHDVERLISQYHVEAADQGAILSSGTSHDILIDLQAVQARLANFRGELARVFQRLHGTARPEPREVSAPIRPRSMLRGWAEMCEAIGKDKLFARTLERLNREHKGPIVKQGPGRRPLAERDKLLAWWNALVSAALDRGSESSEDSRARITEKAAQDDDFARNAQVKTRRADRGRKRRP